jgi:DNA modification methylase
MQNDQYPKINERHQAMNHRIETLADGITLHLGDCREILPTLPPVDAVVTSPPYGQQRDYGAKIDNWTSIVGSLCHPPHHEQTQILVNLGPIYRDGEIVEYWDDWKKDMRAAGWRLFGWYVWDKLNGAPGDWQGRLAPAHEFIFHFNRRPVELNKWVRTKDRMMAGTGLRRADGSMSGVSSPDKVGQAYKIPDSVIRMPPHQLRGGIENEHPALFPVELPRHLAMTFTNPGQTVCDPFMGSGTTGAACHGIGRKFVGIEKEEKYFDIACRRIELVTKQQDLFVRIERRSAEIQQDLELPTSIAAAAE